MLLALITGDTLDEAKAEVFRVRGHSSRDRQIVERTLARLQCADALERIRPLLQHLLPNQPQGQSSGSQVERMVAQGQLSGSLEVVAQTQSSSRLDVAGGGSVVESSGCRRIAGAKKRPRASPPHGPSPAALKKQRLSSSQPSPYVNADDEEEDECTPSCEDEQQEAMPVREDDQEAMPVEEQEAADQEEEATLDEEQVEQEAADQEEEATLDEAADLHQTMLEHFQWRRPRLPEQIPPGSWKCTSCGNINFPGRTSCHFRGCPSNPFKRGDWMCTRCGNHNWSHRMLCNSCGSPA